MEGAALVDDRSGVTFDVELCIPWDAPEAVVDINSAEVVTSGSPPASGFWSQMHAVWTIISTTSQ